MNRIYIISLTCLLIFTNTLQAFAPKPPPPNRRDNHQPFHYRSGIDRPFRPRQFPTRSHVAFVINRTYIEPTVELDSQKFADNLRKKIISNLNKLKISERHNLSIFVWELSKTQGIIKAKVEVITTRERDNNKITIVSEGDAQTLNLLENKIADNITNAFLSTISKKD